MVNLKEFKLKEIPSYHPLTNNYVNFWREQKKRCIEGHWVSGMWMPAKLYFYINFGIIKLNKDQAATVKVFGKPWFRDLELDFFYNWSEARGFSGFIEDQEYTCHRIVEEYTQDGIFEAPKLVQEMYPHTVKENGLFKTYVHAREYQRKIHHKNLGRALYENDNRNMFMLGSRGFGKSYSVGVGVVLHEFLFDGLTEYTEDTLRNPGAAEIVVGAGDAKYSADILSKTRASLERLPGSVEIGGKYYPSPFSKQYSGSWMPASQVTASYKKKVSGHWITKGSMSNIKNRTFKDNPFAANGTRPGVMVFEEVGMFSNIKEAYVASVECQRDGARKFGSMMFLGTGGDMSGGGTLGARDIFYSPDQYDCISFEDTWEFRGKIGYFVPAYMGLNQFKTEIVKGQIYANTNVDGALTYLEKVREKLRTSKGGSTALEGEIVNRPIKPSEMFLARNGNVFPIAELQNRLAKVEHSVKLVEKRVELFFDPEAKETNGVNYKIDTKGDLVAVNDFPWKGNSREGCAVIYELPHVVDGRVPENSYIIGHDPYAKDDPFGDSLGSVYVVKTKAHFNTIGHDEVVASYIGRPFEGRKKINEVMYKLSMFYGNAKIYFENVRGNVKEYFESIGRLDLLAHKPLTIFSKKASYMSSQTQQEYGYPMSSRDMKIKVMRLLRDWLIEERSKDDDKVIRNLDLICDVGLLKELINFNYDGNFDRVMGFAGCVIGLNAMTLQTLEEQEEELEAQDEFHKFLVNNKNLFKPSITTNSKAQHKYLLGFNN